MSETKSCTYCGLRPGFERDHVVAKQFFSPKPPDDELILVPCCSICNRGKTGRWTASDRPIEKDEEYVKLKFPWEWYASRHPSARELIYGKITRSVKQGPGGVRRMMQKDIGRKVFHTSTGLQLLPQMTMSLDWSRVERVICKITRGLYFHETGAIFPTDGQVLVRVLSLVPYQDVMGLNEPITQILVPELTQAGPRRLGRGEFSYTFRQIDPDNRPALISWLMSFYDGILFAVYTYPPDFGKSSLTAIGQGVNAL